MTEKMGAGASVSKCGLITYSVRLAGEAAAVDGRNLAGQVLQRDPEVWLTVGRKERDHFIRQAETAREINKIKEKKAKVGSGL